MTERQEFVQTLIDNGLPEVYAHMVPEPREQWRDLANRRLSGLLMSCMFWSDSEQGGEFWEAIHDECFYREEAVREEAGKYEGMKMAKKTTMANQDSKEVKVMNDSEFRGYLVGRGLPEAYAEKIPFDKVYPHVLYKEYLDSKFLYDIMGESFDWGTTDEGADYWTEVQDGCRPMEGFKRIAEPEKVEGEEEVEEVEDDEFLTAQQFEEYVIERGLPRKYAKKIPTDECLRPEFTKKQLDARSLAETIGGGFDWTPTKEGYEFWGKVTAKCDEYELRKELRGKEAGVKDKGTLTPEQFKDYLISRGLVRKYADLIPLDKLHQPILSEPNLHEVQLSDILNAAFESSDTEEGEDFWDEVCGRCNRYERALFRGRDEETTQEAIFEYKFELAFKAFLDKAKLPKKVSRKRVRKALIKAFNVMADRFDF